MPSLDLDAIRVDGGIDEADLHREGTVYFMRRGFDGPIKVGFTTGGIGERARQLQTGSADKIRPIGFAPGTRHEERLIHAALDDFRMNGEWFFPARKVLAAADEPRLFIASLQRDERLFANLAGAYAVDEAGIDIQETAGMTRAEFDRAMEVFEARSEAVMTQYYRMMDAARLLGPLWDVHPHLTYREVERLWLSRQRKAS